MGADEGCGVVGIWEGKAEGGDVVGVIVGTSEGADESCEDCGDLDG